MIIGVLACVACVACVACDKDVKPAPVATPAQVGLREDLIRIAGGAFYGTPLRCSAGEVPAKSRFDNETDWMVVQNVAAFSIDRTIASCSDYEKCVKAGICNERLPYCDQDNAIHVSLETAIQYCGWRGKRLPNYAEWQRAIRGTDGRAFHTGSVWRPSACGDERMFCHLTSPDGVEYTVLGGVLEWTADVDCHWEGESYKRNPVRADLATPLLAAYDTFWIDITNAAVRCAE